MRMDFGSGFSALLGLCPIKIFQRSSCHIVLFQSVLFFCRWCFLNQTDDDGDGHNDDNNDDVNDDDDDDDDVNDDDTDDDENRPARDGAHVAAVILAT